MFRMKKHSFVPELIETVFHTKPLCKPMLDNWTIGNKYQQNLKQNATIFIHRIDCEKVVCEMVAILSRHQFVK